MHKLGFLAALLIVLTLGVMRVGAYACTEWNCVSEKIGNDTYQTCTGVPDGCSDDPTCQYTGDCGDQVTCGPNYYVCNRGCCQYGTGDSCPCGTNTAGTGCRSCGGDGPACLPVFNCPAGQDVDYNDVTDWYWGERPNYCQVGNASSLYQSCYTDEEDIQHCHTRMSVYGCCDVGSPWTCNIEDTGNEYTWNTTSTNRTSCRDSYDVYLSNTYWYTQYLPQKKVCVDYINNEECGRYEWVTPTVVHYKTTCRDRNNVCACEPACNSTAPSGLSVVQGTNGRTASVSWTPGTGGGSQRLYVDESQTEVNNGCTTPNACEVNATLDAASNSYIVTGLRYDTTYYFRVATYESSSCTPSQVVSYTTPDVTLSGRVYLDTNNNCSTATPWNQTGLQVRVRGTSYTGTVNTSGIFGFYGGDTNPISYLDLENIPATYVPSTAAGCNQGATLTSVPNPNPSNPALFYLTPYREAWWQAVGGSVYAGGSVRSELPSGSEALIVPGAGGALGALMRASGSLDTGAGEVSAEGYSAVTAYRGRSMNYDYFAAHMGVTPSTVNYWAADTMNKPANDPERVFYYQNPSGSEASVTTPWTVAAGESYVVFVNGDLRIAADVVVEEGGFLAFIVNGSLRVSPAVTQIEGLYVVDSTLITESNGGVDAAANFEGSVVTWGGVNLGRDLSGGNAGSPAEVFSYRPDLLVNMPEAMKVFALRWEEVVPGTIGQ